MDPVEPPAGSADPTADNPPKPADPPPAYVTEEQLQTALTARFRTFEQRIDKALSDSLGSLTTKLKGELAELLPKPETKPEGEGGKAPARKDVPDAAPEMKKLQDQIGALTRQAEEARSERDAERARGRDSLLRQRLGEALASAGVDGVRGRHAVGLLVDAERRVRWSDDGTSLVFRTDEHDELELVAGLREWLKTDDAKLYLPARGVQGSGDRPGAQPPPRAPAGPPDRTTVAEGLRRVLLGQL
ncbi:MAG: hypothetical protein ACRELB_25790 [Polyangiaceae bacterium]